MKIITDSLVNSQIINQRILKLIDKSNKAMMVKDIARKLKMHRITAAKHLYYLEGKGKVKFERIGRAKLYTSK